MNRSSKQGSSPGVFRSRGFTLIEMMAVLILVGMILAIAVPSFLAMGRGTKFDAAITQLRATLNQSRQWAITKRQKTYVVFPHDGVSFAGVEDYNDTPLRAYSVFTEEDGYINEWAYLPVGIMFARDDNDHDAVSDTKSIFARAENNKTPPDFYFPTSTNKTWKMSYIGFDPDGSTVHNAQDMEIYLTEGFLDGGSPTFPSGTNAPLFGVQVNAITGGVRVRDYQDL